jgi:uncharacterized protein YbbK (DUF523 family)
MPRYAVSACLAGFACRYDGNSSPCSAVVSLVEQGDAVPYCPEQLGGLSTPRDPAEIVGDKVISNHGKDVTYEYTKGAEMALYIAKTNNADAVVFKANSPSCGKDIIYDGTFTGNKTEGNGIAANMFLKAGFSVFTENEIPELKKILKT